MVVLDTDVLAVYYIFHNDPRYKAAKKLFDSLKNQTRAVTIFNLLEFCGILAAAGKKDEAKTFFDTLYRCRRCRRPVPPVFSPG